MKETVHVNIGSEAFVMDQDAYETLRSYLDDIRRRLAESDAETMGDIEIRLAEIFREKISSPMRVVSLDTVRAAMSRMGAPAEFGECCTPNDGTQLPEEQPRTLRRPRTDRSIAGVCAGIGAFFDIDTTLVRLITLALIFFGGLSLWVYLILWIVIPEAPAKTINIHKNNH